MTRMSILGLYNYDPTIFDGMTLPDNLDRATLISTICLQNAELGLIYPAADTMKEAITIWSTASQYSWNKLAEILTLEYNPIWNKDGTITETETIGRETSAEGTDENKVAAFNESTYQNRQKGESESSGTEDVERSYTRVEQGNIGVTSTQQLIQEELKVSELNVYDRISEDFKNRFCIMVY